MGRRSRPRGPESLRESVYLALKDEIIAGRLESGQRLAEIEIGRLYGVSRTPVREALRKLEADELVIQNSRGFVVAHPTPEEVMEIYELREALEGLAARLAARRAAEADLIELSELVRSAEREVASGDPARIARTTVEFDHALWRASKNSRLVRVMANLHAWQHRSSTSTLLYPGRAHQSVAEHKELLQALRARDEDAAEARARVHMQRSREVRIKMKLDAHQMPPAAEVPDREAALPNTKTARRRTALLTSAVRTT